MLARPFQSPSTFLKPFSRAHKSKPLSCPALRARRDLSTARMSSQTTVEFSPADGVGTTNGGRGVAEVESGTTTTVRRARLIGVTVTTTHGRSLLISAPFVEINPANLTPQHYSSSPSATVAPHPCISAFNASSCSTASAHWYNSFSRCSSSAANKSATSLLRRRAGTTALNRAAKASGRLRRICVMATPAIQIIPVQIFKPHRRPLHPYVPMPRVFPHESNVRRRTRSGRYPTALTNAPAKPATTSPSAPPLRRYAP